MQSRIDHTNLKPIATIADIRQLCQEAKDHGFRGVCINPCYVRTAAEEIKNIDIKIITVVGFPLGANLIETKIFEIDEAVWSGADEVDVVWNLGAFKNKEYLRTLMELKQIVKKVKEYDMIIKVIVESCYLDPDELEKAYTIVRDSGADFIKTSTGIGKSDFIHRKEKAIVVWNTLRKQNGDNLKIKASGGIRDYETAQILLNFGADVLGTSHGVQIIKGKE